MQQHRSEHTNVPWTPLRHFLKLPVLDFALDYPNINCRSCLATIYPQFLGNRIVWKHKALLPTAYQDFLRFG